MEKHIERKTWNKIDWYCSGCGEYWMTTENCSPCARLGSWCHCTCRTHCLGEKGACKAADQNTQAVAKCHECGQDLKSGKELCAHFNNHSQAV